MNFVNCTPHQINLNSGEVFEPSGILPRVAVTFTEFNENGICSQNFGEITGLPEPEKGTMLIVSAMVLEAGKRSGRIDLIAPATGHPGCIREKGHITSVPGFVR